MALTQSTVSQISVYLSTNLFIRTSPTWLRDFASSQKNSTPVASLLATAKIRLLNSDITTSLVNTDSSTIFPSDVHNAEVQERRLDGPVAVQVLGVDDMTQSRWSQIEAIEASERGEGKKGREVIRVVPEKEGEDLLGSRGEGGMCKLLVQDAQGTRVWAMEMKPVKGVRIGMNIGTKMVLKEATMARGVVLLTPECVTILGGKLDNLHKQWVANRKAELKAAIEKESASAG